MSTLARTPPKAAARAEAPVAKLIAWMMQFQFDGDVDYVEVDPVAYAPALGPEGFATYRSKLEGRRRELGPEPTSDGRWSSPHSHDWITLESNAKRPAAYDREVEAIIRTHAKDGKVAAWYLDTAVALAEIGERLGDVRCGQIRLADAAAANGVSHDTYEVIPLAGSPGPGGCG